MEKFKEVEIEQETTEDVIEHGGLERLEKELKKSAAEKRGRQTKEKIDFGGLEIQGQETEPKRTPKEESPEGLAKEVLKMNYYDPDAWEKLREQSPETYKDILLKKSESLAERYLAGSATPEEKVLLDELSARNQGELTDIWIEKSDSYLVEKVRISEHRHTYGQEIKYKELEIPPEVIESWLIFTTPDDQLRSSHEKLKEVINEALPSIFYKKFDEIIKLTKEKNERPEDMEEVIPKLLHQKEIISRMLNNLDGTLFRSPLRRFLMRQLALGSTATFDLLNGIHKLRKNFKKAVKGKSYDEWL